MARTLTEQEVMGMISVTRPTFRNAHDKVVFALHSSFIASGCVPHATDQVAFTTLLSAWTEKVVGIDGWNELDCSYAFLYSYPTDQHQMDSSNHQKKILIKCKATDDNELLIGARVMDKGDDPDNDDEIFLLLVDDIREYVVTEDGRNSSICGNLISFVV